MNEPVNIPSEAKRSRLIKLATRAAQGRTSPSEKKELDSLIKANPELKMDWMITKYEVEEEIAEEFLETCLRVLLGKPTAKEKASIRSLQQSDPHRWELFNRLAFVLQVVGESQALADREPLKVGPMPESFRKQMHAVLEEERKRKESRKH